MYIILSFLSELKELGLYWGVWLKILGFFNFVLPVFFIYHPMAQITILVFLVQAIAMLFLFSIYGFVPLLGIAHFGWFFLLYFFFKNFSMLEEVGLVFKLWFFSIIAVNSVSLVIDVYDVGRYFLK